MTDITTRAEARERGLRFYFTGIPCAHEHLSERYTSTGDCVTCRLARSAAQSSDYKAAYRVAYRATHPERIRAYGAQYYAANRKVRLAYQAAYRAAHPEEIRASKAAYRAKVRTQRAEAAA